MRQPSHPGHRPSRRWKNDDHPLQRLWRALDGRLDQAAGGIVPCWRAEPPSSCDVAIVGAGAAGLATAIFARRAAPGRTRRAARRRATAGRQDPRQRRSAAATSPTPSSPKRDFWGGRPTIVRRVLRAFPVEDTVAFFRELGVPLHEEAGGKLFPDSNRARDVLDALPWRSPRGRRGAARRHARARGRSRHDGGFLLDTVARTDRSARHVVLATGGRSLPKSGSDGAGYAIARRLGHTLVEPRAGARAAAPRRQRGVRVHARSLGVIAVDSRAHDLDRRRDRARACSGALLWTHFGISGPVALNASRHWARARARGTRRARSRSACVPGRASTTSIARWTALAASRPRACRRAALAGGRRCRHRRRRRACLWLGSGSPASTTAGAARARRSPPAGARATEWPLPVTGTRGYNYAEVTAGGVALPRSIRRRWSRACARGCIWWARSWTSTAASAASTSSGPGRAPGRGTRAGGLLGA